MLFKKITICFYLFVFVNFSIVYSFSNVTNKRANEKSLPTVTSASNFYSLQTLDRNSIRIKIDELLFKGDYQEALKQCRGLLSLNDRESVKDNYTCGVLQLMNREYESAIKSFDLFLEHYNALESEKYYTFRWMDELAEFDANPTYGQLLLKGKTHLDVGILYFLKNEKVFEKPFRIAESPFPGDAMILKAFTYLQLNKWREAQVCLMSPQIINDFERYVKFGPWLSEDAQKQYLSLFNVSHKNDEAYNGLIKQLNDYISKDPMRKQALEIIQQAQELEKKGEVISAFIRYNYAKMIDSTSLYVEGNKDKLDELQILVQKEVPEIKSSNDEEQDNSTEIIQKILAKGNNYYNNKKYEEAVFCYDKILNAKARIRPQIRLEVLTNMGESLKALGQNEAADKFLQEAKQLLEKQKANELKGGRKR